MAACEGYILSQIGGVGYQQGAPTIQTFTRDRSQRISDAHGRYIESVYEGNVYSGANAAGTSVTTQAGLSATTPALTLFNPFSSQVNLWLLAVGLEVTAAPAAACGFMLAYNVPNLAGVPTAPTTTTLASITNCKLGVPITSGPVGQCYRVATLSAAPVAFHYLGGTTGAAAISGFTGHYELAGMFCITPGVAVSIQTTSAAALIASMIWEEISI